MRLPGITQRALSRFWASPLRPAHDTSPDIMFVRVSRCFGLDPVWFADVTIPYPECARVRDGSQPCLLRLNSAGGL